MNMHWINGQPVDSVPITDRSFQYGDGCFSTILVRDSDPELWDFHVERMTQALKRLSIDEPDWASIRNWISDIVLSDIERQGIKIHISRGHGGRGYSSKDIHHPQVTISRFDYPDYYDSWCKNGISLAICQTQLGLNPLLAGMKHNNRLEQILIKNELDAGHYSDGVVLDIHHRVIETSMANLFWMSGDVLYTPLLDQAGVAGVMRRKIIDVMTQQSCCIDEGHFLLSNLLNADEIFICNALLGIAPVVNISSKYQYSIGQCTQYLQKRIIA